MRTSTLKPRFRLRPRFCAIGMVACATACAQLPPTTVVPLTSRAGAQDDREAYPAGNPFRLLGVDELPLINATASSETPGLVAARLIDGNRATQWSNGGYRDATAWVAVELAAGSDLASVAVKMPPAVGQERYDVQVSDDGLNWRTVLADQANTSWNVETHVLPAGTTGRWVRLFWRHDAAKPLAHVAVYELAVSGLAGGAVATPGPAPVATPTPPTPATPTPVETPAPVDPAPSGEPPPVSAEPVRRLTPLAVTADSSYAGLDVGRAIDSNLATQWGSGGYRSPTSWMSLDLGGRYRLAQIGLKTGALSQGVTFQLESSDDGATWVPLAAPMTNTTWNVEAKPVTGVGRHVRVRFSNSATAPTTRFYLFEITVDGAPLTTVTSPVPSAPPDESHLPGASPELSPPPVEPPLPTASPDPGESPLPTASPDPSPPPLPSPAPGALGPVSLISVPGRAVASSGNALAAADGDPSTYWSPTGGRPCWLAVPLAAPVSGTLIVAWDGATYTYQNTSSAPQAYDLLVSSDSSDGRDGSWSVAKAVTNNPVRSRSEAITVTGARWVRFLTHAVGSYGPQLRKLEVWAAPPADRLDTWAIFGDSITAMAFDPAKPSLFPATVNTHAPGRLPLWLGAGTGGDTTTQGLVRLAAGLADLPPGGFVGLAYGTNDATYALPVATFKAQLDRMARDVLASGRTPVLARTSYSHNGMLGLYVRAIDELTTALHLSPGPDLYGYFQAHPTEIGPDTVHPMAQGQASIQRLWGEAAARLSAP